MEDWSLLRWISSVFAGLIAVFGVVVLLHGVVYGEWQLNWWYQQQNVNRQTNITFHSVANQSALRDFISSGIAQIDKDTSDITSAQEQGLTTYANSLKPARYDLANQVCAKITQLSDPGSLPIDTAWSQKNCAAGADKPGSAYYYTGG